MSRTKCRHEHKRTQTEKVNMQYIVHIRRSGSLWRDNEFIAITQAREEGKREKCLTSCRPCLPQAACWRTEFWTSGGFSSHTSLMKHDNINNRHLFPHASSDRGAKAVPYLVLMLYTMYDAVYECLYTCNDSGDNHQKQTLIKCRGFLILAALSK